MSQIQTPAQNLIENVAGLEKTFQKMGKISARMRQFEADAQAEIARIRDHYRASAMEAEIAEVLGAADKRIQRERAKYGQLEDLSLIFAQDHRDDLLAQTRGKTVQFVYGEVKYESGRASVKLDDGVKEDQVIERLRRAGLTGLIRVREEIDRQAILKDPRQIRAIKGVYVDPGTEKITVTPRPAAV